MSPTDLVGNLACPHLTVLDLGLLQSGDRRPDRIDAEMDVLQRRGLEHEAAYLAALRGDGRSVVEISIEDGEDRRSELLEAEARTLKAMQSGVDVVFQATFLDETAEVSWRGHADFLSRIDVPSDLGGHSYEPEDTKLARKVKPGAVLQLCAYAEQLERLQGVLPERVHVVLGGQHRATVRLAEVSAYYRVVRRRFLEALTATAETYPVPVAHCGLCRWSTDCEEQRERDDHLSRVSGLSREQARKLARVGISTMAGLGASPPDLEVAGIGLLPLRRLQTQARLQVAAAGAATLPVEAIEPVEAERGLGALPPPDPGDLFYDIEGDPFAGDTGLEYLHGIAEFDDGFRFTAYWAHDAMAEKRAFEQVIDHIVERRRRFPNMHVYHYASYEVSALGKLMGRYGTREDELDDLLRGDVFVDLYRVVRQGLVIGSPSYSLKKLEPLYMPPRTGEITDAGSSIVEYERYLETGDASILDAIEAYNRDDVESTWRLRDWLEGRRAELGGDSALPRPAPRTSTPPVPTDADREQDDLYDTLVTGIEEVPGPDESEDVRVRWLMAQLLRWHEREAKPDWWQYFRRILDDDVNDLLADSECLAGLRFVSGPHPVGRAEQFVYEFDTQEHKIAEGTQVLDPATERRKLLDGAKRLPGPGNVIRVDNAANQIVLSRPAGSTAPHPESLMPGGPMSTTQQRAALRRLARSVMDNGIDGAGPHLAARQLLAARAPRVRGHADGSSLRADGETTLEAAVRLSTDLQQSHLPIQGPPGAGKTYTAARAIVAAVAAGKKVGVTANSHAVIGNVLRAVLEAADESRTAVRILQKPKEGTDPVDARIDVADSNDAVVAAIETGEADIVAGTSFLFAREELGEALDLLVVDEAGQLSLANVLAVATAAANVVLVGDPQQLAQPSKGTHPPGAGVSALDHVLCGESTVAPERGLFLDRTWRMNPQICAVISEQVYDGRLESETHCATQSVATGPLVGGAGLRWAPVLHEGNRTSSEEEVAAISELFDALIGRPWTDAEGSTRPLCLDDLLVVAPYNAQVHLLLEGLPEGARVGTFDKFQGQEAPVAIVSMTASSAEDVPRGMEFLYSRNRLNVAVSRAQALSIVVGSPTLLSVTCRTLDQMRLANVLCRIVEVAEPIDVGSTQP